MAKDRRPTYNLVCEKCGEYNYSTSDVRTAENPLELNKHCSRCGKHTVHKQKKIPSGR